MRTTMTVAAVCAALLLTASCAGNQPTGAPELKPVRAIESATVPQVLESELSEAERIMFGAGLIAMLRYEAGVLGEPGTVIATLPQQGATVEIGSTVTLVIAGPPPAGLAGYAAANRESVIGVARDAKGVWVLAVHTDADVAAVMTRVESLARGAKVRLQRCDRTWAELQKIHIEVSRADFAPGADNASMGLMVDPLACAVRIATASLTSAQITQLTERYGTAVVIVQGDASRAGGS